MEGDKKMEILSEEQNAMLEGSAGIKLDSDDVVITTDENAVLSKMTTICVIRNLSVISISFMLLFSAFNSFASLQSTLNKDDGLGTTGLACAYAVMLLSNLLVTPITLSRFSPKWIMVVSIVTYILYILTGFYSSWSTIIPASAILGAGAAHIWLAVQAYITDIARQYANITLTKHQDRLNLFLGIFYAFHYTSNVWGNLMSSFVFQRVEANITEDVIESVCGPKYCPYLELNTTVILEPSYKQIYTYSGGCAGLTVLSLLLMTCINNIPSDSHSYNVCKLIQQVTRHIFRSRSQQLLFFPTILGGLSNGFLAGDFTLAYISCPYGIKNVGFVLVVVGVCLSLFSVIFGKLTQYTGHMTIYVLGFLAQISVHITMVLWTPTISQQYIIYIMAVLFGIAGAVNVPLISGLYNLYFPENRVVALSCFRVLHAAGWAIAMIYSSWLCTQYKIYILSSILILSMVSLTILHIKHNKKKI